MGVQFSSLFPSPMCKKMLRPLTILAQQGECLRELSLRVQCDNTPREVKNNVVTGFLTTLVSKGIFVLRLVVKLFADFPGLK